MLTEQPLFLAESKRHAHPSWLVVIASAVWEADRTATEGFELLERTEHSLGRPLMKSGLPKSRTD